MALRKYKSARVKNPAIPAKKVEFDARNPQRATHLHAFRTDDELADLLNCQENKSEVIVKALREYFARESTVVCPTCKGAGEVFNPDKFNRLYRLTPLKVVSDDHLDA